MEKREDHRQEYQEGLCRVTQGSETHERKRQWIRAVGGPHLRNAKSRRRMWRAATRAAEHVRDTKRTEEVQRWSNEETSCVSREHLLKVRTLLRQEDSDRPAMLQ